ncbi:MAG: DUF6338 family protein [Thiotrichales bacterium]|nr:DUF6338 family protein [Thiotrichales bacterium]
MNWASSEVVGVLTFLLPGFVAAAIFYSLTSHPRPGAFDRVIQALIFTVIGQAIVALILSIDSTVKEGILRVSNWELILSVLVAVILGLAASYASNRDTVHGILRWLGVTRETSFPSEWYSSFSRHHGCYVVLHLNGQRRLYGWPEEWPSHPDEGHFRISEAEWLVENERMPATGVSAILISGGEVEMVEFLSEHQEQP